MKTPSARSILKAVFAGAIIQSAAWSGPLHGQTIGFSGSETTVTLAPGIYNIIAAGAQGGEEGGLGRKSVANLLSHQGPR